MKTSISVSVLSRPWGTSILLVWFVLQTLVVSGLASEESCPDGRMRNGYSGVCSPISDVREHLTEDQYSSTMENIPNLKELRLAKKNKHGFQGDGMPVPGGLGAGVTFRIGSLQVVEHAELLTTMFVHPNGVNPSSELEWLFTSATNRTEKSVEVVGVYSGFDGAQLGIFDWSCSESYPCINLKTEAGWIFTRPFSYYSCNMDEIEDAGGHIRTAIKYRNRSIMVDQENPPLWRNDVYLWNVCNEAWDLIYSHVFQADQKDCSIDNSCGWWGPIIETFGTQQPVLSELGFEDTMLLHDGTWSNLTPEETLFVNPTYPWELLHLTPNSGFGVGNYATLPPCLDNDGDNYGSLASPECLYAQRDCNDNNGYVNPGMMEIANNGWDDDCDPLTPAYPQTANTMAAAYGKASLLGSGIFNALTLVFIPTAMVVGMRILRRRK